MHLLVLHVTLTAALLFALLVVIGVQSVLRALRTHPAPEPQAEPVRTAVSRTPARVS